jgi:2,3-bisphosphoglycerate-independent phosphoglycerate mutase
MAIVKPLSKSHFPGPSGPVALVIMDGVAIGRHAEGDAVRGAVTPNLDWLGANVPTSRLKAHGTAVGLPSDEDMGNSEVGHNAIGAGRVFDQGTKLVSKAIESGQMFKGAAWKEIVKNCKGNDSTLHLLGLVSDGNVHSHMSHLKAMLARSAKEGLARVRVHVLLDGRDVPPTSALTYIDDLEELLNELNASSSVDCKIASGGGRMCITMDRYSADWEMVERGWNTHVKGEGPQYASATEAIKSLRAAEPGVLDQDLPPFVIAAGGAPIGQIRDGDSVIVFNFRGDRAIEISRAFDEDTLEEFPRGPKLDIAFAGMTQYDGDQQIPRRYLVEPPSLDATLGEYLSLSVVPQLAISETQKFGHVTYFFNGNRSGKFDDKLEDYVEIPSDRVPFDQRPWMKSAEITDHVVESFRTAKHRFMRLNYPNGDMVGHTGDYRAACMSVEAVDHGVGRLMAACRKARGILVISADHGNADEMYERNAATGEIVRDEQGMRQPKTAHSLNPVPVHIYDPAGTAKVQLASTEPLGISSLAATCVTLLGYQPPEDYDPSIISIGALA